MLIGMKYGVMYGSVVHKSTLLLQKGRVSSIVKDAYLVTHTKNVREEYRKEMKCQKRKSIINLTLLFLSLPKKSHYLIFIPKNQTLN